MNKINYGDTCLECGRSILENNKRSLGMHLSNFHKMTMEEYTLKHYFNNNIPLCKCGCDEKVLWHKSNKEYNEYVNGHNSNIQGFSKDRQPSHLSLARRRIKMIKSIDWSIHHLKILFSNLLVNYAKEHSSGELGFYVCKICGRSFDSKRSLANHLSHYDKNTVNFYYPKSEKVETYRVCKICNLNIIGSFKIFENHIKDYHQIDSYEDYLIHSVYDGKPPLCKCGCGKETNYSELLRRFNQYIVGHNSLTGKEPLCGEKSYSYGKSRTIETREKQSQSALKSWIDNEERRNIAREHTIRRINNGDLASKLYLTEWLYNPFSEQKEFMHSRWESMFLHNCIESNSSYSKIHNFRIPYDNKIYIPDFYSRDNDEVIEIKARFSKEEIDKINAGKLFFKDTSTKYRVIKSKKSGKKILKNENNLYEFDNVFINKNIHCLESEYGTNKHINYFENKLDAKFVKDRLLDINDRKLVADNVFDFYREYGFPYIKLSGGELSKEFDNVSNFKDYQYYKDNDNSMCYKGVHNHGRNFVYHFSPQYYDTKKKNGKSFIEIFNSDKDLMDVIHNRMHITYNKEYFGISGAMIRGAMKVMRGANISVFDPLFAKSIYDKFASKNDNVLDISSGFGHRYLGAMSLLDKNLTYVGFDPWRSNIDSINSMHRFLIDNQKIEDIHIDRLHMYSVGAEKMLDYIDPKFIGKFKLCFSSPPYFDTEIYDHLSMEGQSIALSDYKYDTFINVWWKKVVDNMNVLMAPDSRIILNISKYSLGKKTIGKDMINVILNNHKNWFIEDEYKLMLNTNHFGDKSNSKYEHIFILSNKHIQ